MALIKHRPKLSLRAPTEIRPGRQVTATLIVNAAREVPIEAITVLLSGQERVTIGSGKQASTYLHSILRVHAELSGPTMIPVGRHELKFKFELPADAPPSYSFGYARVEYLAEVRVDIDWWPDAVERFALTVGYAKRPESVEPRPRIYSTSPDGPVGNQPGLEASLGSEVVALGGTIEVAVGMLNENAARFSEVRVALLPRETRFDNQGRPRGTLNLSRYQIKVPMARIAEGVPFQIRLPDVPPTLRAHLFRLDWVLEVVGVVSWGQNVEMHLPLELVPEGGVRIRQRLAAAPVGSSRQRDVWEAVARDHGMAFDGQEMRAKVGDAEISVRLGHRGKGLVLVGELTFPNLHIDLDGGAKSSFHRLLRDSVDVGNAHFSKTHYVTGRDQAQVRAFIGALGEWFFAAGLDDVDDDHMTFITQRRTTDSLTRICRVLRGLADRLPAARAAIPVPRTLTSAAAVWQQIAVTEGATLEAARMALHFPRGEDRAAVLTEWDSEGNPYRTTVAISLRNSIDEDYHFLSTEGTLGDGEAPRYGADARKLLERLVEDTPHVRVEAHAVVAHLEAQLEDPSDAVLILKRLSALHALLRGAAGPYR